MQSAQGELEAGEAQGAMAAIAARQRGSRAIYYVLLTLLMAVGFGIAVAVADIVQFLVRRPFLDPVLTGCIGLWVGSVAYAFVGRRFLIRRFRRNMSARDLNVRFRYTIELTKDGLVQVCGAVHRTAQWDAVTEVFRAKKYWIFLVQMEPWFAPMRFFANPADEKAFIRLALTHLSESARDRSKDAVAFATD